MHKSAMKCNETLGKWCKNKHGVSKIIDMLETYQLCVFIFRRLDEKESKENGSRSPPRNGDGDQSTEDEDYFDVAKPGKPSFDHTITQFYNACLLAFKEKCILK
jgi:hypothetical protein